MKLFSYLIYFRKFMFSGTTETRVCQKLERNRLTMVVLNPTNPTSYYCFFYYLTCAVPLLGKGLPQTCATNIINANICKYILYVRG